MKVVFGSVPGQQPNAAPQSTPVQSPKQRAIDAWNKVSQSSQQGDKIEENKEPEAIAQAETGSINTNGEAASQEAISPTPPPPAEAPKAESPPEEPISSQYAALARREKAFRSKMAQERAAMDAERAQLLKSNAPAEAKPAFDASKYISKEDLLKNPLNSLAELGVSYDTLVEQAVNAPKDSDIRIMQLEKQLAEKDKAMAEKLEKLEKSLNERDTKAYQQAIKQVESKVNKLVFTNPEYETIKATGSQKDVVELIEKTFKEDGIVLTEDEAAKEVEAYLVEEFDKLSKISKLQKRLKPAETTSQQAAQQGDKKQDQSQQQLKTLTNSVNSTAPKLSARERALRAFRGEKTN